VTAYFAWHQKKIAKEQAELAREKLRHDLYNRRFEIFSSIFDFYYAVISWKETPTPEQQAARQRFFKAYQESVFLFTKESGIPDLLKMLNDEGGEVIYFRENPDKHKGDPAFIIEKSKKFTGTLMAFEDGLANEPPACSGSRGLRLRLLCEGPVPGN